jgi:hypothetical protein
MDECEDALTEVDAEPRALLWVVIEQFCEEVGELIGDGDRGAGPLEEGRGRAEEHLGAFHLVVV